MSTHFYKDSILYPAWGMLIKLQCTSQAMLFSSWCILMGCKKKKKNVMLQWCFFSIKMDEWASHRSQLGCEETRLSNKYSPRVWITSVLIVSVSLSRALLIEGYMVANYRGRTVWWKCSVQDKKINNASKLKVSTIHQSPVEMNAAFFFSLTRGVRQQKTRQITHSPVTRGIT